MNPLLLVTPFLAFFVTFFLVKRWIPVAFKVGLVGMDMNKPSKTEVAEVGGIGVLAGVLGGLLYYIFLNTFVLDQILYNLSLFATISTVVIISFVGLTDDFLGWKKGLKQWQKPLLTLPAALPMMVINAGQSWISLPIVGDLNLGILYPLIVIPLGIVGAANGFNIIAGFNGLEAGMGIIMISAMSIVTYMNGSAWVTMIGLATVGALIAFMIFNWYPAKIFPGNSFTYMVGALLACMAILGNAEKLAIVLFIPYFIDFILVARKRFKAEAFGKVNEDSSLEMPYAKTYHLTHFMIFLIGRIKQKVYERDVTISILAIESVIALFGILLFV